MKVFKVISFYDIAVIVVAAPKKLKFFAVKNNHELENSGKRNQDKVFNVTVNSNCALNLL